MCEGISAPKPISTPQIPLIVAFLVVSEGINLSRFSLSARSRLKQNTVPPISPRLIELDDM